MEEKMNPIVIKTGPLRVNTVIVPLSGCDAFVVDPAACAFSKDENVIISRLEKEGLNPVAIVLTHGHFDHVSGLPAMNKKYPGIPILIHKGDSGFVGPNSAETHDEHLYRMGFDEFLPSVTNLPPATSFLVDGKSLLDCMEDSASKLPEETKNALADWKIIHTPGHTEGGVCLLNKKEKILVSGDTLFYHSWGRTDLPGGNERELQKSLSAILYEIENDVRIFPGHDKCGFTKED